MIFLYLYLVSCLAGSYFDEKSRKCTKCPKGYYTELPGRLGCSICPTGKTTLLAGTSNSTLCKGKLFFKRF